MLPKGSALTRRLSLVCVLAHLNPYKHGVAGQCLGIPQVFVQSDPLKHPCECRQRILDPYEVSSRDAAIVGIKHDVLLPHRPSQTMVFFLGATDFHQIGTHSHINQYFEDGGGHHKLDVTWLLCQFGCMVTNNFKNITKTFGHILGVAR